MADYNLGTARGRIELDASGAEAGADQANAAVSGIGTNAKQASGAMIKAGAVMAGIGGAAVAGFGVAVNAAANFEERISAIGAVSDSSGAALDKARQKALQLGADTKYSANEAATAMENLVKGGLSLDEVLGGAADATTALAAATDTDLAVAAEVAATAMAAFNLEAKDMVGIADNITGAVNGYVRSTDEFRQALAQSGAVAKTVGLSFEDLSVGINAMAKNGVHGSDAGTSLKTMLLNLQPTTEKQTALFKELGLITDEGAGKLQRLGGAVLHEDDIFQRFEKTGDKIKKKLKEVGIEVNANKKWFTDSSGKMLDFGAVTDLIGTKAGLTAKEMTGLGLQVSKGGNQFFDANGKIKDMANISQVLQDALKGQNEAQKLVTLETLFGTDAIRAGAIMAGEGAAGINELNAAMGKTTAAEVAKKRMDNLKGSIEQFKGSAETALISIGQLGQGPIRKVVDFFTKLLNAFTKMSPEMKTLILMVTGGIAVLIGFAGVLLLVGGTILKVMNTVRELRLAMQLLNLSFLTNPVFLIIAALVALGIALFIAYQKSEEFRKIVDGVFQFLKNSVLPVVSDFIKFITDGFKGMVDFIKEIWPQVSEIIGHVLTVVKTIILAVLDVIMVFWRAWGDDIFQIVKRVFESIRETINNVLQVIAGIIRFVMAVLNGDWGKAWDALKSIVSAVWDQIKNVISTTWGVIKGILGGIVSVFGEIFRPVGNFLHTWVIEPIEGIVKFISELPGRIGKAAAGMFDGLKNAFRTAVNFIIRAWNGLDFTIPGFDPPGPGPTFPGFTLGVPDIKELAQGGIIKASTGGTLAVIGEGGRDEAVIPLPNSISGGNLGQRPINVEINQSFPGPVDRQILESANESLIGDLLTALRRN